MKVAIIGAGLSGVSCAYELKKNGITPTIFEKSYTIGENLDFPAILLNMFNSPISKPFKFLRKEFGLDLKPHHSIKELGLASENKALNIKCNAGYILNRGKFHGSLLHQIEGYSKLDITYNTYVNIEDVRNEFDYVVVATGCVDAARSLNLLTPTLSAYIRVAEVVGDFRTDYVKIWFNSAYAKHLFAYLTPFSSNMARLFLIVDNITPHELDYYWSQFISYEKINYEIVSFIDVLHETGYVYPIQVGNIYFVGNAGGLLDSMLGFGSMKAILSGLYAGRSIAQKRDYVKLIQPFVKDVKAKHEFRKALNTFENKDYDKVIGFLGLPGIKQLVYNNPYYMVTQSTFLAKIYNSLKGNK